jgi:putative Ca2+/H+ antiporter (TMEM165/GDT1 family)
MTVVAALALVVVCSSSLADAQGDFGLQDPQLQQQQQQQQQQVGNQVDGNELEQLEQDLAREESRHQSASAYLKDRIGNLRGKVQGFRSGLMPGGGSTVGEKQSTSLVDGVTQSFMMIMVSEIGDETFIIAALMAMRHPRGIVLAGALAALYVMTVLSTALGVVVPNLISRERTHQMATMLYIIFGSRLFYIAYTSEAGGVEEEIEEVEHKLKSTAPKGKFQQLVARLCTPIFLEAFVLTFLAEWGDRSQIATISLGATQNPYGVTVGACVGHTICTSIAVVGGRLAAMKISQRTVAFVGGTTFFLFAINNLLSGP